MQYQAMIGLLKIELPGRIVRMCDGGFMVFEGETYLSADPLFGTIGSIEQMGEGRGDEIPALDMEMLPPKTAAISELSKPGYQRSRVRFWVGEFSNASGTLTGTPELQFDGQIDQTTLQLGKVRRLSMSIVSNAERLFELNTGNSLNPGFHKAIWPGELGHDNATGLTVPVAWGVEAPRGSSGGGGGRAYGGGSPARARDFREY